MCHGRLCTLLVVSFLTACGPQDSENESGGTKRWASFPVAIYMDSSVASYNTAEENFQEAMSFWEQKAGRKLFDFKGVWNGEAYTGDPLKPASIAANVITFLNPWNYDYSIAGQTVVLSRKSTIQGSIILLNPNISYCYWSCTSELKVITHELGHFLGFHHSSDVGDIMYPEIQAGDSLAAVRVDTAMLSVLVQ